MHFLKNNLIIMIASTFTNTSIHTLKNFNVHIKAKSCLAIEIYDKGINVRLVSIEFITINNK